MSVRRVDFLLDEGALVCLTGDDTDLDDALLAILYEEGDMGEWCSDSPTHIEHASGAHWRGEVEVGRFRKQPCICGGGHGWDLMPVPDAANPRGSFWGVLA